MSQLRSVAGRVRDFVGRSPERSLGSVGIGTTIKRTARFRAANKIHVGSSVRIGADCFLEGYGGIEIGDGTIFAAQVVVLSSSHRHDQTSLLPYDHGEVLRPVVIGRGVWLGFRSMVCPGVRIGDGAVVGMGAVVSRDVPAGATMVGNPAVEIDRRDPLVLAGLVNSEAWFLRAKAQGLRREGRL